MRILRFHKLMSVSVFVIMQVCKVKARMARLFHSDSIVAFFFSFFNFYNFRLVSMSVIISNDFYQADYNNIWQPSGFLGGFKFVDVGVQNAGTLVPTILGIQSKQIRSYFRINERFKENNSLWYSNRVQLIVRLIVTPLSPI